MGNLFVIGPEGHRALCDQCQGLAVGEALRCLVGTANQRTLPESMSTLWSTTRSETSHSYVVK